jgi:hypothetical protein
MRSLALAKRLLANSERPVKFPTGAARLIPENPVLHRAAALPSLQGPMQEAT